jgi:hypothetical protein
LYEDLWRFTLVNYNGGPGCLSDAIKKTYSSGRPLTWDNVIQYLEPGACQISVEYVEDITFMPEIDTLAAPTLNQSGPIQPTQTALPDVDSDEQMQPTPTPPGGQGYPPPDEGGYPPPLGTDTNPYP